VVRHLLAVVVRQRQAHQGADLGLVPSRPEPALLDEVHQQTQQQVERTAAQVAQQLTAEIQAGKLQLQQEEKRIIILPRAVASF